ncbi:hypothetical protein BGZ46_005476 [Entomortierella lignicola]|nr:hypothetical protein BGZ46_005476 [Entomortierella lignicola]
MDQRLAFEWVILESGSVETMLLSHVKMEGQFILNSLLQQFNISLDLPSWPPAGLIASQRALGENGSLHDGVKDIPSKIPMQTHDRDPMDYEPNMKTVLVGIWLPWPGLVKKIAPTTTWYLVRSSLRGFRIIYFYYVSQELVGTFAELSKLHGKDEFQLNCFSFDVQAERIGETAPHFGVMHTSELLFVFGSPAVEALFTEKELALNKAM